MPRGPREGVERGGGAVPRLVRDARWAHESPLLGVF